MQSLIAKKINFDGSYYVNQRQKKETFCVNYDKILMDLKQLKKSIKNIVLVDSLSGEFQKIAKRRVSDPNSFNSEIHLKERETEFMSKKIPIFK